jgi:hypothetical protein
MFLVLPAAAAFPRHAAYPLCLLHCTTRLLTGEKSLFWRPAHSVFGSALLRSWLVDVAASEQMAAGVLCLSGKLAVTTTQPGHSRTHTAGITKWQAPFSYCSMTKVTVTDYVTSFPAVK